MKNIIVHLYDCYCLWIAHWHPASVGFVLQMLLCVALPTGFCALAFHHGSRSGPIQTWAFFGGILLGASFPVDRLMISNITMRVWLISFAFLALLFLPAFLPRLLSPRFGIQKRLRVLFYCTLGSFFLAHLLFKGALR